MAELFLNVLVKRVLEEKLSPTQPKLRRGERERKKKKLLFQSRVRGTTTQTNQSCLTYMG